MATPDTYHDDMDDGGTPDEKIVKEAMRRFAVCSTVENDCRLRFIEDIKFANGDADNLYQWDANTRQARGYGTADERPCLTINQVRQFNLNIVNDAKQNKPSVKVKAMGGGASYDSAQVYESVIKHIEYISNAQAAYDTATTFQVQGGIGWLRLATDYPDYDDKSFDQEIYIRRVKDPLTIYLDPDIRELDGSDARFGFVFDDMSREVYCDRYPKHKDLATKSPLDVSGDWVRDDQVRVAEYYRVVEDDDQMMTYMDPAGQRQFGKKSELKKSMEAQAFKTAIDDPQTKTRDIKERKVEWFLIAGDKIIERSLWAGRYIPLIRVIGEETNINGQLDRKGHTRALKDPQRLSNYWYSACTEHVALQSKTPYIGPMAAFENLETYWDTANTINHSWLPFNQYDDKGQKLEAPTRQPPPIMAEAYIKGLQIADEKMKQVAGQFEADLGMPGNEKSGVAIQQRQRQGDNATYHYIDGLAVAIRFIGKQLVDLIPKIYDTQRILKIKAEDGVEHEIHVDPQAEQAYQQAQQQETDKVQAIFNPNVGYYDVEADIGPAYATRRQEAFQAFMQLAKDDNQIMAKAGDLIIRASDLPMADKIAERMKPEQGPSPQQIEQQKQMQGLSELVQKLSGEVTRLKADKSIEEQQKDIDRYKAITDRMKVLLPLDPSEADRVKMIHDLNLAEQANHHGMMQNEHQAMLASLASQQDHGEALEQGAAGHDQALEQQAQAPQPQSAAA
jgi:hypothetical protein